MHELSLIQTALDMALDCAMQQGATQIHRIQLSVGALSGVVPEALEFAFEVVTQGTIAAEADLEVRIVPGLCYCGACQQVFEPTDWFYECPHCYQPTTEVRRGRELELTALEVS